MMAVCHNYLIIESTGFFISPIYFSPDRVLPPLCTLLGSNEAMVAYNRYFNSVPFNETRFSVHMYSWPVIPFSGLAVTPHSRTYL